MKIIFRQKPTGSRSYESNRITLLLIHLLLSSTMLLASVPARGQETPQNTNQLFLPFLAGEMNPATSQTFAETEQAPTSDTSDMPSEAGIDPHDIRALRAMMDSQEVQAAGPSAGPGSYFAPEPFINFESPHVYPLDLTPDKNQLLAVNTADNTLMVFDVTSGTPIQTATIAVGLDPVSVRARSNTEAWVVNHLSDSVSVVALTQGIVRATIATLDEPADVIFAGDNRAFITASQENAVEVFDATTLAKVDTIRINGQDPRSLAVSPDGNTVYAAIFESGNGTTLVPGGKSEGGTTRQMSVTDDPEGPWGGLPLPPNQGDQIVPPMRADLPQPKAVSMIVRKSDDGRWLDDNNGDWSRFISGDLAERTLRVEGWDLVDRDVAIIDANTLGVSYQTRLMNIVMGIAIRPNTGQVTVVGTEALNEIRFEPNLKSTFVRVNAATFTSGGQATITDLNPHLDYSVRSIPQAQRNVSIGDPRGATWNAAGSRLYVTGMGSNNLAIFDQNINRVGRIEVGEGPTGVVLNEENNLAFVMNKFDSTISTVNLGNNQQVARTAFFDPTPAEIKIGRKHLYDTHATSGLGQVSCASCHIDGRADRLAWDLGDPSGEMITVDGIEHHPMKGPFRTMTLQDAMNHGLLHWRGDKPDIGHFRGAFVHLQGADEELNDDENEEFRRFLNSIHFPPNPFRNLDNSLSTSVAIPGPGTTTFATKDAVAGLAVHRTNCSACHTGNTGRSIDAGSRLGGTNTQNFLYVPSMREVLENTGLWHDSQTGSHFGFGHFHDGSLDSTFNHDIDAVGDLDAIALLLSFTGSLPDPDNKLNETNISQDAHAAVGKQVTFGSVNTNADLLEQLHTLADEGAIGFVAHALESDGSRGYTYIGDGIFQSDRAGQRKTLNQLHDAGSSAAPVTFTAVPLGSETRIGIDRNLDGVFDGDAATAEEPIYKLMQLGDRGEGVFTQLAATGSGYIMYSREDIHTRFASVPVNAAQAAHLVAVKLIDNVWNYDTGIHYIPFVPQSTDVLLADIDFGANTAVLRTGNIGKVSGIIGGFARSDLELTPNGNSFQANGSFIVLGIDQAPSESTAQPVRSGIAVQDDATGTGFILYSEENVHRRFTRHRVHPAQADHFVAVKYVEGAWLYDNNETDTFFRPRPTDVLVATVNFDNDSVQTLSGQSEMFGGVQLGYAAGSLSFTPNRFGGQADAGEFEISVETLVRGSDLPVYRYDFGTSTSLVEMGHTRITPNTQNVNFGWTNTADLGSRDRIHGNALTRDFVFSNEARTFEQAVADGRWRVEILFGDMQADRDDMAVKAEGQTVLTNVDTLAGEAVARTVDVDVTDGRLSIEFSDGGGDDASWTVSRLTISNVSLNTNQSAAPTPDTSATMTFLYDFGTEASSVAADFTRVTPTTQTPTFGWVNTDGLNSVDRGRDGKTSEVNRDFVFCSCTQTFEQTLPNGTWQVWTTFGDNAAGHSQISVLAEEQPAITNLSFRTGQFIEQVFTVDVLDGKLSLEFSADGNQIWPLTQLVITNNPDGAGVNPGMPGREIVNLNQQEYNYDFGTPTSPVADGWTRITPSTTGDISWSGAVVDSRDRGAALGVSNNNRDLVLSRGTTTFDHKIANGTWRVTMNMGDASFAHDDMVVKAEGETINNNVDSAAGQFVTVGRGSSGASQSFNVVVTDGVLNIELSDGGGSSPHWVLTHLSLVRQTVVDLNQTEYRYDFGTLTSPVADGWTRIDPTTTGDISWSGAAVDSRERNALPDVGDINRDFVLSSGTATFDHKIANGIWRVTMNMGDASFAHENMIVKAEGETINNDVDSAAGQFATVGRGSSGDAESFEVVVTDGMLNIELSDGGGSSPYWILASLSLDRRTVVDLNQIEYNYDFGTPTSKVEDGWTRIDPTTFGDISWSGAVVDSRDRGAAPRVDSINRDFVFSSDAATFNHKIANGPWRVVMNMGDRSFAYDDMIVKAEGETINNNIDSAASQFVNVGRGSSDESQSFDVVVTDGTLNIELSDGGGSNPNWVLNRISISRINRAPIANAGANQVVTDTDLSGSESITLDGSRSVDHDGTIISYAWSGISNVIIPGTVNPTVDVPIGVHEIQLMVTDNRGATDTSTSSVTVEAGPILLGDTTCDQMVNVIDALAIMQFEVQMRTSTETCPLQSAATTIFTPAGDVNNDETVNVIDALMIMQCEVGIANIFCP